MVNKILNPKNQNNLVDEVNALDKKSLFIGELNVGLQDMHVCVYDDVVKPWYDQISVLNDKSKFFSSECQEDIRVS